MKLSVSLWDFPVIREASLLKLSHDNTSKGVYFIGLEAHAVVKIGYSRDIQKRMGAIQTGMPWDVFLLAHIPSGTRRTERFLHKYFHQYSLRGEWFSLSDEISHFLEKGHRLYESLGRAGSVSRVHQVEIRLGAVDIPEIPIPPPPKTPAVYGELQASYMDSVRKHLEKFNNPK